MSNRKGPTNLRGARIESMSGRAQDSSSRAVIAAAFATLNGDSAWDGKPRNRAERRQQAQRRRTGR